MYSYLVHISPAFCPHTPHILPVYSLPLTHISPMSHPPLLHVSLMSHHCLLHATTAPNSPVTHLSPHPNYHFPYTQQLLKNLTHVYLVLLSMLWRNLWARQLNSQRVNHFLSNHPSGYPIAAMSNTLHALVHNNHCSPLDAELHGASATVKVDTCHRASFSRSLSFFFTSFSTPSTQLPHLHSPFTRSRTNNKTIEHDNIGTIWPSYTWWPTRLHVQIRCPPKNTQRLVLHCPLPRRVPSPHQAGDSQEESPQKPRPPLPA